MDRKIGMIAVCGLLIASLTGCSSWFSPDAAKLGQDMNVALDSISSLSGTLDVSGVSEDDSFFLQASFSYNCIFCRLFQNYPLLFLILFSNLLLIIPRLI